MGGWNLTGTTEPLPWEKGAGAGALGVAGGGSAGTSGMGAGGIGAGSARSWGAGADDAAPADGSRGADAAAGEQALTVTQAAELAGGALAAIPAVTLVGEVSGFKGPARSGHCYFQIKDEGASLECIIWRGVYGKRSFDLRDGMQVLMTGTFSLYKPQGRMSFHVKSFRLAGEGLLRQQVAERAERLRREGLMDASRKRPIPAFCSRIAVVTSSTGAVINDVKRTLLRRNPLVEIVCVDSKVEGAGAEGELIEALARAARIEPAVDCILLVRGGGSYESLMTFNDEALARAVAASPVPVVTGIGHEPDTTICDMVGDSRQSTPTAAAESVAPAITELQEVCEARAARLVRATAAHVEREGAELERRSQLVARAMRGRLDRARMALDAAAARPCLTDPTSIVDKRRVELAQTEERLSLGVEHLLARFSDALAASVPRVRAASATFSARRAPLELMGRSLAHVGRGVLDVRQRDLREAAASLDALSPLKVLARGYSIAYGERGVVTSAAQLAAGDALTVRFADGRVQARVLSSAPDGEAGAPGAEPFATGGEKPAAAPGATSPAADGACLPAGEAPARTDAPATSAPSGASSNGSGNTTR